jgi:very-short-patch-repair endonuclease
VVGNLGILVYGRNIDRIRTRKMEEVGYKVFRFWESDIYSNLDCCLDRIQ